MNPFGKTYAQELEQRRAALVPTKQAEDTALCIAGHAAYMWAFSDDAHFDANYFPCFCGQHKGRRVAKSDENPRAIAWLYGGIAEKSPPAKCNRSWCEVHKKSDDSQDTSDAAFCVMAHKNYIDAYSDLPGFDPNDLACVCGLHKERLGE